MRLVKSILGTALLAALAPAQSPKDQDLFEWHRKQKNLYWLAGNRHIELGSWCRKIMLVPQATTQFLRAVEVSEGQNERAQTVLSIMRALDDKFWLGERKKPNKDYLAEYARRAKDLERTTRIEKLKLAQAAMMIAEPEEAKKLYLDLVQHSERPAVVDDKGRIKLEEGFVPADVVKLLGSTLVTINGNKVVRDEALQKVPKLDNLRETASDALVLRSDLDDKACASLHALASALLPQIDDLLDGKPSRRLSLIVFKQKTDYEAYLQATGRGSSSVAPGLCDYGAFTTLVCAEGLEEQDLQSLVLHELSHLFFYGTAPAVMPDWYAEGFAESFGAQGTFEWDGKKLVVGGLLRKDRLEDLKKAPLPLTEMLASRALESLTADRAKGLRFYAQCWAFQRYLRSASKPVWRDKFLKWEAMCRGAVVGAVPGKVNYDAAEANKRFQDTFGKDLTGLEKDFLAWLAKL